ncbi:MULTISPECIES: molybdopterin-containing oxidoreductase family protein [Sphingobium]|uniref:molybdopterin-containing oxidoreductase family protein n=1 Tax=Sphingobium TaxID=165695 RepID=UPI00159BF67D|nr:molybdopterin-dependent oxidoreductase [Sphingobium sp. 15-1]
MGQAAELANIEASRHRKVPATCKVCHGACGTILTLDENDQILQIAPDRENPLTQGYACFKGLQTDLHSHPGRLLHPLKRLPDGSFQKISAERALDEIADRLGELLQSDGPSSIAGYYGTGSTSNILARPILLSWLTALGSHLLFSSMTVDQPAKWVTPLRLGTWSAGKHRLPDSDVYLIAGSNPITSHLLYFGLFVNPIAELKAAKARGMKLIVIDPRRSETAHYADILLQPYPGEDPTVVAGLIRIILDEGLEDKAFCARYTEGLDALRKGVERFTPSYVQKRAGVPVDQLHAAALMFAKARRGAAYTGTGPNMAPHANLAEHLYECLNVICGRYYREGDPIINPGVLVPRTTMRAEVVPPTRPWESGKMSRVHNVGMMNDEMMSAVLPDEILAPGPGRIKSLFILGGNPVNALPDTHKVIKALEALDLLVVIDPNLSTTARYAHYILPPKLNYEYPTIPHYEVARFFEPFSQFSPAAAKVPAGSDVLDEHHIFWALASRLGKKMHLNGVALDMEVAATVDDMLDILTTGSQVPLSDVKKYPHGHIFDVEAQFVEPGTSGNRFDVFPTDVEADLNEVAAEPFDESGQQVDHGATFTHRLTCRRMRNVMNSVTYLPTTRKRHPFNAAFLHPDDIAMLDVSPGAEIDIESAHGSITGIVMPDDRLRPGTLSMTHGFGGLPGDGTTPNDGGANVGLLISLEQDLDKITAMPRLSAIPVNLRRKVDVKAEIVDR